MAMWLQTTFLHDDFEILREHFCLGLLYVFVNPSIGTTRAIILPIQTMHCYKVEYPSKLPYICIV